VDIVAGALTSLLVGIVLAIIALCSWRVQQRWLRRIALRHEAEDGFGNAPNAGKFWTKKNVIFGCRHQLYAALKCQKNWGGLKTGSGFDSLILSGWRLISFTLIATIGSLQ
jgi:hypothetical protein